MKILPLLLLLTSLDAAIPTTLDYRDGKQINICYQTAELFEGAWYPLTYYQKRESAKLKLIKHTPNHIIIGDTTTTFIKTSEGVDFYSGKTKMNKSVIIEVEIYDRSILNITLGDLHTKEFKCIKKEKD